MRTARPYPERHLWLAIVLLVTIAGAALLVDSSPPVVRAAPPPTQSCPGTPTPDLSPVGSTGIVNGAIISHLPDGRSGFGAAGSGTISEFKRLQHKPPSREEDGYNTTGTLETWDDDAGSPGSFEVLLSSVPTVSIGGVDYRQFIVDLNEDQGAGSTISLDDLEIYCAPVSNADDYPFTGTATPVFFLEVHPDNVSVLLEDHNSGSGEIDYIVSIPQQEFTDAGCQESHYVYLYSAFGSCAGGSSGFEEWARSQNPISPPYDLGDLPDVYLTTLEDDGPVHVLASTPVPILGTRIDAEPDGQPSTDALGDDTNGASPDDEDGVLLDPSTKWEPGQTVNLRITLSGSSGYVVGWFDFNSDGDFGDTGERVAFGTLPTGQSTVQVALPASPGYSTEAPVYARFRLYPTAPTPGTPTPAPFGRVDDGEVEDYYWEFGENSVTLVDVSAEPTGGSAGLSLAGLAIAVGLAVSVGWAARRRLAA